MKVSAIPTLSDLLNPQTAPDFASQLKPAKYGGVRFGVLSGEAHFGRRQAIHEYPFRDKPWVEDLGKSARRISITGFLVENDQITKGGSAIAQRDNLIAAAESPGISTLEHPSYGKLDVSLLEISVSEKWDKARYFEIRFTFIEAGNRVFPSIDVSTGNTVDSMGLAASLASDTDFRLDVVRAIHLGQAIIQTALRTANMWIAIAKNIANDASNLFGMIGALPGNFGRLFGGASSGFMASAKPAAGQTATIPALINAGSLARAKVVMASAGLNAAVTAADSAGIAAAAQTLVDTVLATSVNPADGVRLMISLAVFTPNTYTSSSAIGLAQSVMQTSMGNLFRRSAIIAMARASATYQPSSSNDAYTLMMKIVDLLDNEITIAGDNGEDATFNALRALRQAVVADLSTRGASLPAIRTFNFQASLPAAALSLRLYRDAGRADEIESQTNAPHPAFQPRAIRVLSR
jgi:prophage DNA circulation protein